MLSWIREKCQGIQWKRVLKTLVMESLGVVAVALVAHALWSIYEPAAEIFVGLVCGALYLASTVGSLRRDAGRRR